MHDPAFLFLSPHLGAFYGLAPTAQKLRAFLFVHCGYKHAVDTLILLHVLKAFPVADGKPRKVSFTGALIISA